MKYIYINIYINIYFFFEFGLEVKMVGESEEVEDFHLHGPSGAMSFILPSVDALLGIRNTSAELREAVLKLF